MSRAAKLVVMAAAVGGPSVRLLLERPGVERAETATTETPRRVHSNGRWRRGSQYLPGGSCTPSPMKCESVSLGSRQPPIVAQEGRRRFTSWHDRFGLAVTVKAVPRFEALEKLLAGRVEVTLTSLRIVSWITVLAGICIDVGQRQGGFFVDVNYRNRARRPTLLKPGSGYRVILHRRPLPAQTSLSPCCLGHRPGPEPPARMRHDPILTTRTAQTHVSRSLMILLGFEPSVRNHCWSCRKACPRRVATPAAVRVIRAEAATTMP